MELEKVRTVQMESIFQHFNFYSIYHEEKNTFKALNGAPNRRRIMISSEYHLKSQNSLKLQKTCMLSLHGFQI